MHLQLTYIYSYYYYYSYYLLFHGKMRGKNEDNLFPYCLRALTHPTALWQLLNTKTPGNIWTKIQKHLQNIFLVTDGCSVITRPDVDQIVRMEEAFKHVHELRWSTRRLHLVIVQWLMVDSQSSFVMKWSMVKLIATNVPSSPDYAKERQLPSWRIDTRRSGSRPLPSHKQGTWRSPWRPPCPRTPRRACWSTPPSPPRPPTPPQAPGQHSSLGGQPLPAEEKVRQPPHPNRPDRGSRRNIFLSRPPFASPAVAWGPGRAPAASWSRGTAWDCGSPDGALWTWLWRWEHTSGQGCSVQGRLPIPWSPTRCPWPGSSRSPNCWWWTRSPWTCEDDQVTSPFLSSLYKFAFFSSLFSFHSSLLLWFPLTFRKSPQSAPSPQWPLLAEQPSSPPKPSYVVVNPTRWSL